MDWTCGSIDPEEAQAVTSCLFRTPAYEPQGAAKGGSEQHTAGTQTALQVQERPSFQTVRAY